MTIENSLANPALWPDDAVIGLEVTPYIWPFVRLGTYFEFFHTPIEFEAWKERMRGVKVKYVVTEYRWDWGPQRVDTRPRTI